MSELGIKKWDTEASHPKFLLFKVVVSALLTNLSTVVPRGDGYYELQSTTCVYGILLISHHFFTMHCFKSKCCWLCMDWLHTAASTNRVRDSTTYLLSEGATSVLSPISFLLKGCDCLAFILFQVCSLCTNRVILPTRPAVWSENLLCFLTPLDTMLSLLDGVGLALLLAHWVPIKCVCLLPWHPKVADNEVYFFVFQLDS